MEALPAVHGDVECADRSLANAKPLKAALLTGGIDRPYAFGLAMALAEANVEVDFIGSDELDSPEMHSTENIHFLNLWPPRRPNPSLIHKVSRTLRHYISLIRYSATARPRIFHILWNSKIQIFDRTLLMLYFLMLKKNTVLTAHNVNQARRDSRDSWLNQITLRIQYRLVDHIFVHTEKMKDELIADFAVPGRKITIIRHPINNAFPDTQLDSLQAKNILGLNCSDKTILCFGRIKPYKGIEYLLTAFRMMIAESTQYKLIIAGEVDSEYGKYLASLKQIIGQNFKNNTGSVILKAQFIRDEEIEIYFKAADILVLPYKDIFQSGVLFLGYSYGLPVIATDVGSFRQEIVEGETGYVCRTADPADLATTIETYFRSDLYRNPHRQQKIRRHAEIYHSWGAVADLTRNVYDKLIRSE